MPIQRPTVISDTTHNVGEYLRRLADGHDAHETGLATLAAQIAALPKPLTLAQIRAALQATGTTPLNMGQLIPVTPTPVPPTPGGTPTPGGPSLDLTLAQPAGIPAAPNLRWFRANFGGVHIPGLTVIPGGLPDGSLVYSFFYDQYSPADRATIRAAHLAHGYTHFKLSWPNSRNFGTSEAAYVALAQELTAAGFYVGHFLSGKQNAWANDPPSVLASLATLLPALQAAGVIPWACVGWEMDSWQSPTQIQQIIDGIAAILVPGTNLYVHLTAGKTAWQVSGFTANFWIANVGKLTGLLFQSDPTMTDGDLQARITDGLTRFAGNFLTPSNSGFGHPFDLVAYETSATNQLFNGMSEAGGDHRGLITILTPASHGPAGTVVVQGFGNGARLAAGGNV
jgi:hypothetical protein